MSSAILSELSIEMLTWEIPPNLDPTCHPGPALQFDELGGYIDRARSARTTRRRRPKIMPNLGCAYRGWASQQRVGSISTTEPSEKIHVFLFSWENREAELRCKTASHLVELWDNYLGAVQREWEEKGMRSQSLHLSLVDFGFQVSEREWKANAAVEAK